MALRCFGHNYCLVSSVLISTELTEQLITLGISSELSESMQLNSPRRLNGKLQEVKIPDTLVENIYSLYNYDDRTGAWIKITNYKQVNNKLILSQVYHGIVIAFPFDAFREDFYADGEYMYEMYMSRIDSKVYRNITISGASYRASEYVTLSFSFNSNGPWLQTISSPFIIDTFYMRVSISNYNKLTKTQVIPSELITLTCLSCE